MQVRFQGENSSVFRRSQRVYYCLKPFTSIPLQKHPTVNKYLIETWNPVVVCWWWWSVCVCVVYVYVCVCVCAVHGSLASNLFTFNAVY